MTTLAPPALVTGAARQPLLYGLFSTFTLRAAGSDRWEGGVRFDSADCSPADGIGQPDRVPEDTLGLPKNLDDNRDSIGEASPFTVYGHYTGPLVGLGAADAQSRATDHLIAREESRVEQAFWTGDLGNTPKLEDAGVTSVQAAAASAVRGVGLLEDFIADSYGSLGVLHMTRAVASMLLGAGLLESKGGRLLTKLGTPVAAGSGYPGTGPTGQAAAAGTSWVFVTPALFGYRSDIFTSSAAPYDLAQRGQNNLLAVAERSYLLGFDPCGVGAALVNLP